MGCKNFLGFQFSLKHRKMLAIGIDRLMAIGKLLAIGKMPKEEGMNLSALLMGRRMKFFQQDIEYIEFDIQPEMLDERERIVVLTRRFFAKRRFDIAPLMAHSFDIELLRAHNFDIVLSRIHFVGHSCDIVP